MTKRLESSIREIEEARQHFEMIFETIPDATIISNIETGALIAYNRAFFEMTKFSKEENNLINYLQKSLTIIEQLLEGQEFITTAHVKKKDIFTTNSHHIITHNLQELKNISTQIIKKIRKISQCEEWKN